MDSYNLLDASLLEKRTLNVGSRQLHTLTIIRFFAALHVVVYHFSGAILHNANRAWTTFVNSGHFAVDFFFVLSGFVLTYNYAHREFSYWTFIRLRVARIYPAYLLAMILATPAVISFASSHYSLKTAWLKSLTAGVAYVLMIQAWIPRVVVFWNFPGWSISDEMFFYLCFPIFAKHIKSYSNRACFIGTVCCLLIGYCLVTTLLSLGQHFMPAIPITWLSYFPLARVPEFVIGMLAAGIFLNSQDRRPGISLSLTALIVSLSATSIVIFTTLIKRTLALEYAIIAPLFALLIYGIAELDRGSRGNSRLIKPLILLGNASYSIYILQWPVFQILGLNPKDMTWGSLALYVFILIATSIAALKLVEEPLRKMLASPRKQMLQTISAPAI